MFLSKPLFDETRTAVVDKSTQHHFSQKILTLYRRQPDHEHVCNITWTSPVSAGHRTECSRDPRSPAGTGAPLSPQELPKTECTHRSTLVILGLEFCCWDYNQGLIIDTVCSDEAEVLVDSANRQLCHWPSPPRAARPADTETSHYWRHWSSAAEASWSPESEWTQSESDWFITRNIMCYLSVLKHWRTCSSMFHTTTEPSQLAEAWQRKHTFGSGE